MVLTVFEIGSPSSLIDGYGRLSESPDGK